MSEALSDKVQRAVPGEEFAFPEIGLAASTVLELNECIKLLDESHFNEYCSRDDFSHWISHALHDSTLSAQVSGISDRQSLEAALEQYATQSPSYDNNSAVQQDVVEDPVIQEPIIPDNAYNSPAPEPQFEEHSLSEPPKQVEEPIAPQNAIQQHPPDYHGSIDDIKNHVVGNTISQNYPKAEFKQRKSFSDAIRSACDFSGPDWQGGPMPMNNAQQSANKPAASTPNQQGDDVDFSAFAPKKSDANETESESVASNDGSGVDFSAFSIKNMGGEKTASSGPAQSEGINFSAFAPAKKEAPAESKPEVSQDVEKPETRKPRHLKLKLNEDERNDVADYVSNGLTAFEIDITLDRECILKSSRALMIFKKIERIAEVITSFPSIDSIEESSFGLEMFIIVVTDKREDEIREMMKDVPDVYAVDVVLINEDMLGVSKDRKGKPLPKRPPRSEVVKTTDLPTALSQLSADGSKSKKGIIKVNEKIVVKTEFDEIYDIVQKEEKVKLSDIAKRLNVKISLVEEWSKMLEESGLLKMRYSPFGPPLVIKVKKK